ncbi:MAG: hypothetical protein DRG40_00040 [Deltaproteobacteria bacterium]|nr:MAG: hypothetical protein DRG40_00040 [Deltaproteobacteria bacterium]
MRREKMVPRKRSLAMAVLGGLAGTVLFATAFGLSTSKAAAGGELDPMMVRTALKVLLLLGCGAAALFYLQRRRHRKGPGGERIKSLGFLPVGGKERILLLEVMGEKVLVGVTENQITLLSHLSGRKSPFNPRSGLDEVEETAPLCFEYEEDEVKEWRSLPEVMKSFEEKIREFRRGQ